MTEHDPELPIEEHLASDPEICAGQVCVKGTRINAALILGALAGGERDDVAAVLAYGAKLAENVHADAQAALAGWGHDVATVHDEKLAGIPTPISPRWCAPSGAVSSPSSSTSPTRGATRRRSTPGSAS